MTPASPSDETARIDCKYRSWHDQSVLLIESSLNTWNIDPPSPIQCDFDPKIVNFADPPPRSESDQRRITSWTSLRAQGCSHQWPDPHRAIPLGLLIGNLIQAPKNSIQTAEILENGVFWRYLHTLPYDFQILWSRKCVAFSRSVVDGSDFAFRKWSKTRGNESCRKVFTVMHQT